MKASIAEHIHSCFQVFPANHFPPAILFSVLLLGLNIETEKHLMLAVCQIIFFSADFSNYD